MAIDCSRRLQARRREGSRIWTSWLWVALVSVGFAQDASEDAALRAQIRDALAAPQAASVPVPDAEMRRAALVEVYGARQFAPLWHERGQLTPAGRGARDILARASEWGLRPADYAVADDGSGDVTRSDVAGRDIRLSLAVARFLEHTARGRVDPVGLGVELPSHATPLPLSDLLSSAARGDLATTLAGAEPRLPVYARLKSALGEVRRLAATHGELPPLAIDDALEPGEPHAELSGLVTRLAMWGDLASVPTDLTRYDEPVVEAVKRFQARHGLTVDGVVGAETLAALAVPPAERARELELAIERVRWLTRVRPGRVLLANVAAFEVQLFDRFPDSNPTSVLRIVAGDAEKTPTPLFTGTLRSVVFRPFWYPPVSILTQELLPALRRDPDYFVKNAFELVANERDDAEVLEPTPDRLAALASGTLRLRQRPGDKNALGTVKFIFPNRHSVYMHDTPARGLFARARRDFSHGCVRVDRPLDLAAFVLGNGGTWDAARIAAAASGGSTLNVDVRGELNVVVFYSTADVAADGAIRFFRDLYALDPPLFERLASGAP